MSAMTPEDANTDPVSNDKKKYDYPGQHSPSSGDDIRSSGGGYILDMTDPPDSNPYHEAKQEESYMGIAQQKKRWHENISQFEMMKERLDHQQRKLLDLFATLRTDRQTLIDLGQPVCLPSSEDLKIINVATLSPEHMLQLCCDSLKSPHVNDLVNAATAMNINLLQELPNRYIATCEQSLISRIDLIKWFEEIISKKILTKANLINKINHFKAESEELKSLLLENKQDYKRVLSETNDILIKNTNVMIANQFQTESCVCKLSQQNALIEDLRKKLRIAEQQLKVFVKTKTEELEKELREEKYKKTSIKDRLSKAETLVKFKEDKLTQLKIAHDQVQSQTQALENKVTELREENQKIQSEHDKQIHKLQESVNESAGHLEEVMAERSKLLTEKEDLQNQLQQFCIQYEEVLETTKNEMNSNVAKFIEVERKYNESVEEKKKLNEKIESLCKQLYESECRLRELSSKLAEVKFATRELTNSHQEMETLKCQMNDANKEVLEYKELVINQKVTIQELQQNFNNVVELKERLEKDLNSKGMLISELQMHQALLEQRLQDSESKTESYAVQLSNLKNNISEFHEELGEFENWEELYKMIKQQIVHLRDVTEENNRLKDDLTKKDIELQQQKGIATDQGLLLEERDNVIKTLKEKDDENNNIITLLRNNLDMRTQADIELSQQHSERNTEIESLISNLDTRKHQIIELEKIIITLENQNQRLSNQKRKACETISAQKKKLIEYDTYFMTNTKHSENGADNLDNLINILERELANPLKSQLSRSSENNSVDSETFIERQNNQGKCNQYKARNEHKSGIYQTQDIPLYLPSKKVMGNHVNKIYPRNEDKADNLGRKPAITSMETTEWTALPDMEVITTVPYPKDKKITISPQSVKHTTRNISCCPDYFIGDKKNVKMFKLAGHRL